MGTGQQQAAVLARKPRIKEVNKRARCVGFQAQHSQEDGAAFTTPSARSSTTKVLDLPSQSNSDAYANDFTHYCNDSLSPSRKGKKQISILPKPNPERTILYMPVDWAQVKSW